MATLTITLTDDMQYGLYALRQIAERANAIEGVGAWVEPGSYPKRVTIEGEKAGIDQVFTYFYKDAEDVLSAASNIEHQKYRKIIEQAAEGIRDQIKAGDFSDFEDDDLTEAIESAGEVIYYSEAAITLRHSRNDTAYEDAGIGEREVGDDCIWASFAQAADIREELGDLEELFDQLAPLTDDDKEEARDAYALILEERGADTDRATAIWDCTLDLTNIDAVREKMVAYLTAEYDTP